MIQFEFKKSLLIAHGAGNIDLQQILDAAERVKRHPLFSRANNLLADMRDVHEMNLVSDELRALLGHEGLFASTNRRVAIVATDDLLFGLARMYQSMAEGVDTTYRVFRDYYLALAWLMQRGEPTQADWEKRRRSRSGN